LHVDRFGTYITTPSVSAAEAVVDIKTTVKNEYKESKNISLVSKLPIIRVLYSIQKLLQYL